MTAPVGETADGLRLGVMVSGRGVALRMAARACATEPDMLQVVAVAGSVECPALRVAQSELGIAHVSAFRTADHGGRRERDALVARFFLNAGVNFVFTAGYMDVVDQVLLDAFPDRLMSIYPSLLPAYGDEEDTLGAPLRDGVKLIGVTYHLRTALERSAGPIIAQQAIPVDIDDTVESVEPSIATAEEELLGPILQAFAHGRVSVEGGRVRIARSFTTRHDSAI
jgi:phosphoribosylglycinamide formyltransferase-1